MLNAVHPPDFCPKHVLQVVELLPREVVLVKKLEIVEEVWGDQEVLAFSPTVGSKRVHVYTWHLVQHNYSQVYLIPNDLKTLSLQYEVHGVSLPAAVELHMGLAALMEL